MSITDPNKQVIDVAGKRIVLDFNRINFDDWLKLTIATLSGDNLKATLLAMKIVAALLGDEAKKLTMIEGQFAIAKTMEALQEKMTGMQMENEIEEIVGRNKPE